MAGGEPIERKNWINKINCPKIAVDAVIQLDHYTKIVLIKRKYPPLGLALPGGFVDYGESLEEAVIREAKEETNLDVYIQEQFPAFSDPDRDPRGHIISVPFWCTGHGKMKAQDDAKELVVVDIKNIDDIDKLHLAFVDHRLMIYEWFIQ